MNGGRGRQIAQDQPEGVIGADFVVAVGHDEEERRSPIRRPRKRSNSIEAPSAQWASSPTMTVGPGRAAKAASTSRKSRSRASPSSGVLVDERPSAGARSRTAPSGPGVESASQEVRSTAAVPGDAAAERVDQGGLAHSGLAANEHQAPVPRRGMAQMLIELIQVRFALE